jgi:hypothetical protein
LAELTEKVYRKHSSRGLRPALQSRTATCTELPQHQGAVLSGGPSADEAKGINTG